MCFKLDCTKSETNFMNAIPTWLLKKKEEQPTLKVVLDCFKNVKLYLCDLEVC